LMQPEMTLAIEPPCIKGGGGGLYVNMIMHEWRKGRNKWCEYMLPYFRHYPSFPSSPPFLFSLPESSRCLAGLLCAAKTPTPECT